MTAVPLSALDLGLAAALILLTGLLSWWCRLGLERSLAVAAARMVVQLGAVGFVLKLVFEQASPPVTLALAVVMTLAAGHEVWSRQEHRIRGPGTFALGAGTLFIVGLSTTLYTVAVLIGPEPWHAPRYVLPILGMVLGNALTGIALVLNTMVAGARRERAAIEGRLALGASRLEATSGVVRHALKTGMLPILNAMAVAGLVSLPGMMTGQILAGADPDEAAKYQIMIMFVLSGATSLAVALAALGGVALITDERHRLRLDRLVPGSGA
jgi:putative ABC transport system permease protein